MSDLLFLADLLTLLLSAYYTDRVANAFIASQSVTIEAQHGSAPATAPADQLGAVADVRRASLSMGPDAWRQSMAAAPRLESFATGSRALVKSPSRGKRDTSMQAGLQLDMLHPLIQLLCLHVIC